MQYDVTSSATRTRARSGAARRRPLAGHASTARRIVVHAARIDDTRAVAAAWPAPAARRRSAACRPWSAPRPAAGEVDVHVNGRHVPRHGTVGRRGRDAGPAPPTAPAGRSASSRRCPARSCGCWWPPGDAVAAAPGSRRRRSDEDGERAAGRPRWPGRVGRGHRRAVGRRGSGAGRRGVARGAGERCSARRSTTLTPRAPGRGWSRRGDRRAAGVDRHDRSRARCCAAAPKPRRRDVHRPPDAHRPARPQSRPRPRWWSKTCASRASRRPTTRGSSPAASSCRSRGARCSSARGVHRPRSR